MIFNTDTTTPFNSGSRYDSVAERSHKLAHSERYGSESNVQFYKNDNIDLSVSKYNMYKDNIVNGLTPHQILYRKLHDKCVAHDYKVANQGHYNRMYGAFSPKTLGALGYSNSKQRKQFVLHHARFAKDPTNAYLKTRWLKAIRTLPLKLGNKDERLKLIKTCVNHGVTLQGYASAINYGYLGYVNHFNATHKYMKITNMHTNLDEQGGDHAHIDYLALGTTKAGNPSFAFNRAIKQDLGKPKMNRKLVASAFIHQQVNDLHKSMTKSFKKYTALNIQFHQISHEHKGHYINNLGTWQHMKDANRMLKKQNASLAKRNYELSKDNNQLKNRNLTMQKKVLYYKKQNKMCRNEAEDDSKYQALLAKFQNLSKEYKNLSKQSRGGLTSGTRSFVSTLIKKSLKSVNK